MASVSDLVPIFRSDAQRIVLTEVFLRSPGEATAASIARRYGVPFQTVNDEVRRLLRSGLILQRIVGRARLLGPNDEHPAARGVRQVLMATSGALLALASWRGLAFVEDLYVFGSWARRSTGEPGPFPRDLDVIVIASNSVTDEERFELALAAVAVGEEHDQHVDLVVVTRAEWEAGSPLIDEIKSSPLLRVAEETY